MPEPRNVGFSFRVLGLRDVYRAPTLYNDDFGSTIGARTITTTILWVPYSNYSIMCPQNPILIIKAPTLV